MPTPRPPADADETARNSSALAKYSGIAIQMFAIIGLSTWAGVWLDGRFHTTTPWYTIGLTLTGIFLALFQVIRSVTQG
ncbi:MAG: AtpZ/AtpI family protein [Hymenobacter sp.]